MIGPRSVDELLDIVVREKSREDQALWVALLLFVLLPVSAGIALYHRNPTPLVPLLCLCPLIASRPNVRQRCAVYALTQTNDLRVLPTLIQATRHAWGWHPQISAAILRLLEHISEEHGGLLNEAAQRRLWTICIARHTPSENYDYEATLRVLRALAAVGNQAALARIRRFAHRSEHFINERYVIAEARRLVPIMEARLQRQQAPETLLRAADTPTTAPEILLRPTPAAQMEQPEQLLRSSTSDTRSS